MIDRRFHSCCMNKIINHQFLPWNLWNWNTVSLTGWAGLTELMMWCVCLCCRWRRSLVSTRSSQAKTSFLNSLSSSCKCRWQNKFVYCHFACLWSCFLLRRTPQTTQHQTRITLTNSAPFRNTSFFVLLGSGAQSLMGWRNNLFPLLLQFTKTWDFTSSFQND